jgi:hypothetical protein
MRDTLFLQFYSKSRFSDYYDLGNGFSDTWELCKSKGDMIWFEYDGLLWSTVDALVRDIAPLWKCETVELPIKKGTIYVSALYVMHLYQCLVWAKKYPNIKFIVGGPAVRSDLYVVEEEMPSNLIITSQTVEELFSVPNFKYDWKLEVPDNVSGKDIIFSYTLDTSCYWSKCIYCNYAFCKQRIRDDITFGFENVEHDALKIVKLNSPSLTPKLLDDVIPRLPRNNDIKYDMYIRSCKAENDALKRVIRGTETLNMKFISGIEYPSDRVLKMLDKGITVKEILNTINIFDKSSHELLLFIILFWDNLQESDLDDMEKFIDVLPHSVKIALTRIFVKPYTKLFDEYEPAKQVSIGPFYLGFIPKINQDQIELSKRAKQIIKRHPNLMDYTKGAISYE